MTWDVSWALYGIMRTHLVTLMRVFINERCPYTEEVTWASWLLHLFPRQLLIITGLFGNVVGKSYKHIRAGDFGWLVLLCWTFVCLLFCLFIYCTNLFLSLRYGFGLRADLRREIACLHLIGNTGDELCCSGTDHKKSARGTWRDKGGGKKINTACKNQQESSVIDFFQA